MTNPASKLINILIGKAVIETILVGALAVGFFVNAFPPTFHGWGEAVVAARSISGWAVNDASPWERVEVQLFIDDKLVEAQVASKSRPDVKAAGWARDEWHGYEFQVNGISPGAHTVCVYAVHKSGGGSRYTLQLLGDRVYFKVSDDGNWLVPYDE